MRSSEGAALWSLCYYRARLPGEPDVYTAFLAEIDAAASPGARVLDVGCGEEFVLRHLAGRVGRLTGLDVREREHPYDELVIADIQKPLPLADKSVDLVVCKFVFEHLEQPGNAAGEIRRILAPGGCVIILTPDIRYFPYTVNFALSRLLSQTRRMKLVAAITGRPKPDIYPVRYRSNTPSRLRRLFEGTGLRTRTLDTFSDFRVIAGWKPLGFLGTWYEVLLNRLGMRGARGFILGVFERSDAVAAAL